MLQVDGPARRVPRRGGDRLHGEPVLVVVDVAGRAVARQVAIAVIGHRRRRGERARPVAVRALSPLTWRKRSESCPFSSRELPHVSIKSTPLWRLCKNVKYRWPISIGKLAESYRSNKVIVLGGEPLKDETGVNVCRVSLHGITSAPVRLNTCNVFLYRCWFYDSYKCTCREFVADGRMSIYAGCCLCLLIEAGNPQRQEKPASRQ